MSQKQKACVLCERQDDAIPLIQFDFRGETYWICPQHLPMLIHDPAQLVGKLEGAENLAPSDYHD